MEPLAAFVASSATKVVLAALAVIASVVWCNAAARRPSPRRRS